MEVAGGREQPVPRTGSQHAYLQLLGLENKEYILEQATVCITNNSSQMQKAIM